MKILAWRPPTSIPDQDRLGYLLPRVMRGMTVQRKMQILEWRLPNSIPDQDLLGYLLPRVTRGMTMQRKMQILEWRLPNSLPDQDLLGYLLLTVTRGRRGAFLGTEAAHLYTCSRPPWISFTVPRVTRGRTV
jgi:hypothetical protein